MSRDANMVKVCLVLFWRGLCGHSPEEPAFIHWVRFIQGVCNKGKANLWETLVFINQEMLSVRNSKLTWRCLGGLAYLKRTDTKSSSQNLHTSTWSQPKAWPLHSHDCCAQSFQQPTDFDGWKDWVGYFGLADGLKPAFSFPCNSGLYRLQRWVAANPGCLNRDGSWRPGLLCGQARRRRRSNGLVLEKQTCLQTLG